MPLEDDDANGLTFSYQHYFLQQLSMESLVQYKRDHKGKIPEGFLRRQFQTALELHYYYLQQSTQNLHVQRLRDAMDSKYISDPVCHSCRTVFFYSTTER